MQTLIKIFYPAKFMGIKINELTQFLNQLA